MKRSYYILMPMIRFVLVLCLCLTLSAQQRILVHGHRGARAVMPENTIPAFEYAIAVGADVLELDMGVTKDNVVVVSHDPVLHAPICKGPRDGVPIRELTLAELREWDCGVLPNPAYPRQKRIPGTRIPTLDEVFRLASKGTFEFNIETKIFANRPHLTPTPEEFVRLVLAEIRKHKLEKRVIVQSFDYRTLIELKRVAPEIRTSALMENDDQRDFVSAAKAAGGAPIISPNFAIVTPEKVAAARKAGLHVVPWTINTPDGWDRIVKAGADAIISDDPAALIEWLKKR